LVIVANIAFGRTRPEKLYISEEVIVEELDNEVIEAPKVVEKPTIGNTDAKQNKVIEGILDLMSIGGSISKPDKQKKIEEIKENLYGEEEIK